MLWKVEYASKHACPKFSQNRTRLAPQLSSRGSLVSGRSTRLSPELTTHWHSNDTEQKVGSPRTYLIHCHRASHLSLLSALHGGAHPSNVLLLPYTLVRALLAVNFAWETVDSIGGLGGSIFIHISKVAALNLLLTMS